MKLNKVTLTAIFTLSTLLGGTAAFADSTAWGTAKAAADDAREHGNYALAETCYKQAIDLQTASLGANSPEVAVSLNNLAVFYQDQSLYPQAENTYQQALDILEKNLLQEAPTAHTLNNLAALYHEENQDAKAEFLYARPGNLGKAGEERAVE